MENNCAQDRTSKLLAVKFMWDFKAVTLDTELNLVMRRWGGNLDSRC
jgi:hypothetical protein